MGGTQPPSPLGQRVGQKLLGRARVNGLAHDIFLNNQLFYLHWQDHQTEKPPE